MLLTTEHERRGVEEGMEFTVKHQRRGVEGGARVEGYRGEKGVHC